MNLFDVDPSAGPAEFKACCAVAYESPLLTFLLGSTWRPGGTDLTSEIANALRLEPEMRVLDVASGAGETASLLTREFGASVVGVDLSFANLKTATERRGSSHAPAAEFAVGDAELLPLKNGAFDAVFCECSFCTFPDKAASLAELYRVTRPGG
ncbi:MAG: class I SAM-dependent methyltransferase, partial [Dehalococcoidia bacterium]